MKIITDIRYYYSYENKFAVYKISFSDNTNLIFRPENFPLEDGLYRALKKACIKNNYDTAEIFAAHFVWYSEYNTSRNLNRIEKQNLELSDEEINKRDNVLNKLLLLK